MTPFDTIFHILPALGVLAFLLLHRRQSIHAELEELRLRQEHGQMLRLQSAKQSEARASLMQAFAPALTQLIEPLLAQWRSPGVDLGLLDDETLMEEIERRVVARQYAAGPHPSSCCAEPPCFDDLDLTAEDRTN